MQKHLFNILSSKFKGVDHPKKEISVLMHFHTVLPFSFAEHKRKCKWELGKEALLGSVRNSKSQHPESWLTGGDSGISQPDVTHCEATREKLVTALNCIVCA